MNDIDRRTFVTSLAAVAVAGLAPVAPIRAATSPLLRFAFGWRPGYDYLPSRCEAEVARTLYNSAWLYDHGRFFARWSIRHLASGLTFCQSSPHTPAAWAVELDHIDTRQDLVPTSYAVIHPIGYAACHVVGTLRFLETTGYRPPPTADALLIRYSSWELPDPFELPDPLSIGEAEPLRPAPISGVLTMPHTS